MVTALLLFLTVVLLLLEHWFPHWESVTRRKWFDALTRLPNPVRLIVNYVTGTLAIAIPFSIWLWTGGYLIVLIVFWMFLTAAGLTVILAYAHDQRVRDRQRLQELREERELYEQSKGTR
jgi:hypothetical protein